MRTAAGWILVALAAAGCGDAQPRAAVTQRTETATTFDATTAGTIRGRVTWAGEVPVVAPFRAPVSPLIEAQGDGRKLLWDNPHVPAVDSATKGVANAVVFLRGVDPRAARPWSHPPVLVEQTDYRFRVRQGETTSLVGFVKRGNVVEMVSRQAVFHSLHAGGAAFFTLTFPDPDRPRRRRLERNGLVELTSAAGHFWMRAYLFVDEHPYYARTDTEGRFTFDGAPPGEYDVVCWLPNWNVARHERDPETNLITRLTFQPPATWTRTLTVSRGGETRIALEVSAADFRR